MTRSKEPRSNRNVISAAIFAAQVFLATFPLRAAADQAVLTTAEGLPVASGEVLAFDTVLMTLRTEAGLLSLRAGGLLCDGPGCPGPDYAPHFRIAVSDDVDPDLLPALAEAYARDQGFDFANDGAAIHLSAGETPVLRLTLERLAQAQALDLFAATEVHMLLLGRDLGRLEVDRFRRVGLGQLNTSRQSQFIALDALVPVVSAISDRPPVAIAELLDVLDGRRTSWPGTSDPVTLHILSVTGDGSEALIPSILAEVGGTLTERITWHDTAAALLTSVDADKDALGLIPASRLQTLRELPLTGPCGVVIEANRLAIKAEDYPLSHPINLYLPPWRLHPEGAAFVDWLRGGSAQAVVRRAGLADISPVAIPVDAQGERLANAILAAGRDVPLEELQRMLRFLRDRERLTSTFRFEPGSTRLDSQSRESVLLIAEGIASGQFTGSEITFVGFSDGRGPADANRDLAFARAETVRAAVASALGAAEPYNVTLATASFGEALPIACDDTPLGQRTNRRVEIWVRPQP